MTHRISLGIHALSMLLLALTAGSANAADSGQLTATFDKIYAPQVNTDEVSAVDGVTFNQKDFTLRLDSGVFIPYQPIHVDGERLLIGGVFFGEGRVLFRPSVPIERSQLRRFFESDSLHRRCSGVELFFTPSVGRPLLSSLRPKDTTFDEDMQDKADDIHAHLVRDNDKRLSFKTLKNVIEPSSSGYLLANVGLQHGERVVYRFDPTEREEIELFRRDWQFADDNIELVCKYAVTADETYADISGFTKERLLSRHYRADVRILKSSEFTGTVEFTFDVLMSPTRIFAVELEPEFQVEAVRDSTGKTIPFRRWEDKWHKRRPLYIFLDRPLTAGETVTLTFDYHGKLTPYPALTYYERQSDLMNPNEFFVSARSDWVPRYGFMQPATYEFTLRTPAGFTVCSSAEQVDEERDDDELITRWTTEQPVRYVAFDVGNTERYQYSRAEGPRVEVYFSEDLHRFYVSEERDRQRQDTTGFIRQIGANMKDQVADDVANAIRLFSHYFGEYEQPIMIVTESLEFGGVAYPGYLKLGARTWITTDHWGWNRMVRAREVAHQWWGGGVSWATYRDQWLSEGFAEYSSLMYLQAVAGNDLFLDRLDDYREEILDVRKYIFHEEEECGPIALGYRTSSTKIKRDYDLVIYKKAAFVLHMLRNLLIDLETFNEDRFLNMMKDWYQSFNGRQASTADFQRMVEKHVGMNMDWFFRQWIYGNAIPVYRFSYELRNTESGRYLAECRVKTEGVDDGFRMYVPVEIVYTESSRAYMRVLVDSTDIEFTLPPMTRRPEKIRFNPFLSVLAEVHQ